MAKKSDIETIGFQTHTSFQCKACGQNFAFVPFKKLAEMKADKTWDAFAEQTIQKHLEECDDVRRFPYQRWAKDFNLDAAAVGERMKDVKGTTGKLSDGSILTDGLYTKEQVEAACADLFPKKSSVLGGKREEK